MRHATFFVGAACVLSSAALQAQSKLEDQTGSHIKIPKAAVAPDSNLSDEELGRELMNQFARCIIDRRSSIVAKAIAAKPGEDLPLFIRASADECLSSGRMQFPPEIVRGAVFGELYRRQQKQSEKTLRKFPVEPINWSSIPSVNDSERLRMNYYLLAMTDCIQRSHAEEMRLIVASPVGSAAQKAAYSLLIPAIGPCVPEGQKLSITRAMLEAAFGEYLYRSLVSPIPAVERGAG